MAPIAVPRREWEGTSEGLERWLAERRRYVGAVLIGRLIAIREHPACPPKYVEGSVRFERALREKHGDPREAFLRQVVGATFGMIDALVREHPDS